MTAALGPPAAQPRHGTVWRRQRLAIVCTVPTVLFLLVLFAIPVVALIGRSFNAEIVATYEKALTDGLYLTVLWNTMRIALIVTVGSFLLGFPLAWVISVSPPGWRTLALFCVLMPFWTSILVRTYAWMVILGREGVINSFLLWLGVVEQPLRMLNTEGAVVLGMIHVLMPFFVFPVLAVMGRIDRNLLQAAAGLGAPGWRAFTKVYFPLTLPGVMSGCILVFILSMGFFITPALLGGGKVTMIAVLIEKMIREFLNWELAAALSAVLLVTVLLIYGLFKKLFRGDMQWN